MSFVKVSLLFAALLAGLQAVRINRHLQQEVLCDICGRQGNLWNIWQHEYKNQGGTGSSSERAAVYNSWKRECNCNLVRSAGVKLAMGPACVAVNGQSFVTAGTSETQCSVFDKEVDAKSGLVRFKDRNSQLCLSWAVKLTHEPFTIVPGVQGLGASDCGKAGLLQSFTASSKQYCLADGSNHASHFCLFSDESAEKPFVVTIVPEPCMTKVFKAAEYQMNLVEGQPLLPLLMDYSRRYSMDWNLLRTLVDGQRVGSQSTPQSLAMESDDALDVVFEQGTPAAQHYHMLCQA